MLVVLAVLVLLVTIALASWTNTRDRNRLEQCKDRLQEINHAVLTYTLDNNDLLPEPEPGVAKPHWWW